MSKRPQFSLKTVFVIIMVLAVPLGLMVATQDRLLALWGIALFIIIGTGCAGFLLGKWRGAWIGVVIGGMYT